MSPEGVVVSSSKSPTVVGSVGEGRSLSVDRGRREGLPANLRDRKSCAVPGDRGKTQDTCHPVCTYVSINVCVCVL